MRQVVLDTETTGLEVEQGHRIIEIGCVELINRRRTSRNFHRYIRPDRDIDAAATEVHGISIEQLADKPGFAEIAPELREFLTGAELVIHNAAFDLGFLRHEFLAAGQELGPGEFEQVVDTLALARQLHPGQRNSLDALCRRYSVDNSGRDHHGALLDAELLADVYLAMTGGQATLLLDTARAEAPETSATHGLGRSSRATVERLAVSAGELAEHAAFLELLDRECADGAVWRRLGADEG